MDRHRERTVYVTAVAVFVAASALTLSSARMMDGAMPMAGGWTMGMAWMRMPGQSWIGAAFAFGLMWFAMMVAMMLPSSLPMLLLYRRVVRSRGEAHSTTLTWLMGFSYFATWTAFGVGAYVAGMSIAAAAMASPLVSQSIPLAAGAALIFAGAYQLTPWKSACLQHCRDPLSVVSRHLHRGWRGAVALGAHHGLFCMACCWALMLMQLVLGVMNLAAMCVVALVIAVEKLTPRGERVARVVGVVSILAGAFLLTRDVFRIVKP
jgi:predicted metal-binding membrane protein